MTKMFKDIIYLDGFIYIVDRKNNIEPNDYYIDVALNGDYVGIRRALKGDGLPFDIKIIATDNPKLEGVPRLPKIPELDYKAICVDQTEMALRAMPTAANRILGNLWEMASSKKYNEEDMRKLYEGTVQNVGTLVKREDMPTWEQVLQSLTPKIKEIELEIIDIPNLATPHDINSKGHIGNLAQKLLVDDKGFLTVKSIKYE